MLVDWFIAVLDRFMDPLLFLKVTLAPNNSESSSASLNSFVTVSESSSYKVVFVPKVLSDSDTVADISAMSFSRISSGVNLRILTDFSLLTNSASSTFSESRTRSACSAVAMMCVELFRPSITRMDKLRRTLLSLVIIPLSLRISPLKFAFGPFGYIC